MESNTDNKKAEKNISNETFLTDEKILDALRIVQLLYIDGKISFNKYLSVIACYCPPNKLEKFPSVVKYLKEKYGDNYCGEFANRQKKLPCCRIRQSFNQPSRSA